jgi:hypothetical protein
VKKLILIIFLATIPKTSYAQACTVPSPQTTPPTYTCPTGVVRTIFWDYAGSIIAGDVFRVYVDNVQFGPDIPARVATGITAQLPITILSGTHSVAVSVFRPSTNFETIRVPMVLILTDVNPNPPKNLRIV